jgi:hypothetical protein
MKKKDSPLLFCSCSQALALELAAAAATVVPAPCGLTVVAGVATLWHCRVTRVLWCAMVVVVVVAVHVLVVSSASVKNKLLV